MKSVDKKTAASPGAEHHLKRAALELGRQRTEEVVTKLQAAMRTIEAEVAGNGGIYPENKGALSLNELARRADVHNTTLHGKKYRELLTEARSWLQLVKAGATIGRGKVRKSLATRVDEWKELFEGLQESHRNTELQLQQTNAELEAAHRENVELRQEVRRLESLLTSASSDRVVTLRPKKS